MAVKTELVIHHHGCVTEGFQGGTSLVQIGADRGSDLFLLHADDEERLEDALVRCEEHASNQADVIDRSETTAVFRGINPPGGVIAEIRDSDCTILWPVTYRDGLEHYQLLAPSTAEVEALVQALGSHGDVSVRQVTSLDPEALEAQVPLGDLVSTLTGRQLDALLLAVERGYYETPRRVTAEDLAEAFGVGASTFSEHVRKAERALLKNVSGVLAHHEALARQAKKGAGRPPDPL